VTRVRVPFLIIIFVIVPHLLSAQDGLTDLEELLIDPALEEEGESLLLELLDELARHPIELNRATWEELAALPWVTPELAKAIVSYRKEYGYFSRTSELRGAPGVDEELFRRIAPFVCAEPWLKEVPRRPFEVRMRTRIRDRHPHREGYLERTFSPTRYSVYNRLSAKVGGRVSLSLLAERDPGEPGLTDHMSGAVSIRGGERSGIVGALDRVVVGDYQLQFGQGLVFGPRYAVLKGRELVSSLRRQEQGIIYYASADETRLLRGVVTSLGHRNRAVAFVSLAHRDATLSEEGTSVQSVYATGLHRTETERAKKDKLEEQLMGARLRWQLGEKLAIGATGYHATYAPELDPPLEGGRYYSLRGRTNQVLGADALLHLGELGLFGEHAWCRGGGRAWLAGASYLLGNTETITIIRDYDWDFYNDYGFALSDVSGEVRNERGALFGLRHRVGGSRVWFHYDIFEHPWRRYLEEMPTRGQEYWLEVEQRLGTELAFTLRRRSRSREARQEVASDIASGTLDLLTDRETTRLELTWRSGETMRSRLRGEWVETAIQELGRSEDGRLIFWGSTVRPYDELRLETRWIWFATDSYDSRIYEFENDLPGVMRNMPLWGRGSRWYVLIGHRFLRRLDVTVKYAQTEREGELSRGSGVEERRGRSEYEYGLALDLVW